MNATKICFATAALALAGTNTAFAYSFDGNLSSWLQGAGNWDPKTHVKAHEESDGVLSPGGGGQIYDAEAMYLDWDNNNLYIAVVSGTPETGTDYGPGDLAINFGTPVGNHYAYGLETTGKIGARARMENNHHGNTQITRTNGNFKSGNDGNGQYYDASHWSGNHGYTLNSNRGSLYSVAADGWGVGLPGNGVSNPTSILKGDEEAGIGDGIQYFYGEAHVNGDYTIGGYGGDHYLIEAAIPVSIFGTTVWESFTDGSVELALHWTQNCGNDNINLTHKEPPGGGGSIPEPGTIALMSLGFVGLGFYRRRKRQV